VPVSGLVQAQQKMTNAGVPQRAIDVFTSFYAQLEGGATGMIAEAEVEPLTDLVRASDLALDDLGTEAVASTAVIKLNGGLGTSMGMDRAKSLLPVRADLTFLDIIVGQVQHVRHAHDVGLPLLFMNSFRTNDDKLAALSR
jgi:UTP--glucose-1-phosphate uridylyltransferase